MKCFTYILLSFLLTILFSCEFTGDLSYDYKYPGDKLVINALISPDTGVIASITRTVPPNQTDRSDYVDNPILSLYENDVLLFDLERVDSTLYASPQFYTPKVDAIYRIRCSAIGLKTVTSNKQVIPKVVGIDSVIYKLPESSSSPYLGFTVWLTDPATDENYYNIRYYQYINGEEINNRYSIFSYEPIYDNTFNGKSHSVTSQLLYKEKGKIIDSVRIVLYSITSDVYKYLKSIDDYDYSSQDPFFVRPSTVYSNINGGYGIFGAFSSDSKTIRF